MAGNGKKGAGTGVGKSKGVGKTNQAEDMDDDSGSSEEAQILFEVFGGPGKGNG